jgi:hypothetical protein
MFSLRSLGVLCDSAVKIAATFTAETQRSLSYAEI